MHKQIGLFDELAMQQPATAAGPANWIVMWRKHCRRCQQQGQKIGYYCRRCEEDSLKSPDSTPVAERVLQLLPSVIDIGVIHLENGTWTAAIAGVECLNKWALDVMGDAGEVQP